MGATLGYFVLAWAISWLAWLPLYAPGLGLAHLPMQAQYALGAYGPAISAIVVTALTQERAGVATLLRRVVTLPRNGLVVALALLGPLLIVVAAAAVGAIVPASGIGLGGAFHSPQFPDFSPPVLFGFYLLTYGLGEEIGWRGFALPRLSRRFGAFAGTLILAVGWAIWHLPLFLFWPGFVGMGLAGAAGWFVSLLLGAFILSWLLERGEGSLLAPILFHAMLNTVFANDAPGAPLVNAIGACVTIAGVMTAIDLRRRSPAVSGSRRSA